MLFGSEKRFRISILANNYFDSKALSELGQIAFMIFQVAREIKVEVADYEGVVLTVKAPEELIRLALGSIKPCHVEVRAEEARDPSDPLNLKNKK